MTVGPHHDHDHVPVPDPGYETKDAKIRPIAIFGVGLVALIACSQIVLYVVYKGFIAERPPAPPAASRAFRSQPDIYEQMAALRRSDAATLGSYGWVDREKGIVRIPIDRAIDLVVARGVPKGKGPKTEIELNSRKANSP